ncbi:MAG: aspartate kinase [Alistipes sp.]|nr:aspartate kinase [Alistipes sp.]
MKVYKFGGASVRNADGVRNLHKIIGDEQELFVIVSAMGKTTNALERVFGALQRGDRTAAAEEIAALRDYHAAIVADLWHAPVRLERVEALFAELERVAAETDYRAEEAELWYDRIVAYGELLSTTIVSEYLNHAGLRNRWVDMRRCFLTEQRHKDAGVDIEASTPLLRAAVGGAGERVFVGQGFIGAAPDGTTTTLGREGSDYSAAVAAHILEAESMAVWKDVDGVLNADPKIFPDAVKIAELNYLDTIELAYSGAQIIHPKTIKPLQNKNIPLYVRPFGDKRKPGTVIRAMSAPVDVPILILKKDQVLLTIRSRDFSFVLEEKFATIFSLLERFRIKTNLIHNSAVNLSLCVDDSWHIDEAVAALREAGFDVMKSGDMELLTVRGYTDELWRRYARGPQVFVRQATQSTVRVVRRRG